MRECREREKGQEGMREKGRQREHQRMQGGKGKRGRQNVRGKEKDKAQRHRQ